MRAVVARIAHLGCRALAAAILLMALLAQAGCGPKPQALPVAAIPWADGETTTYAWVEGGSEIGTGTFSQTLTERGWLIHNTAKIGEYQHTGDVVAHPQTLLPISSRVANEGAPAGFSIDATYDDQSGRVNLVAHTVQGEHELAVRLPKGHYIDNEQLLTTLRALPLSEGYRFTLNLVNTAGGQKVAISVEVRAVETIALSVAGLAGEEHRAYRVALLGGAQTAWYTVEAPHILLKYDNGQRQTVLRRFEAGGL